MNAGPLFWHSTRHSNTFKRVKSRNWLFSCSQMPQQLHKDTEEDRREEAAFSLFPSPAVFLWRHAGRVGQVEALPWGQTGCTGLCLCECGWACTLTLLHQSLSRARRLLELSVLLWTLSFNRLWGGERVRDRRLKDKRQMSRVRKTKSDSVTEGELLFIAGED